MFGGKSVSYFDSRMLKNDFHNIFDILNKIQIKKMNDTLRFG